MPHEAILKARETDSDDDMAEAEILARKALESASKTTRSLGDFLTGLLQGLGQSDRARQVVHLPTTADQGAFATLRHLFAEQELLVSQAAEVMRELGIMGGGETVASPPVPHQDSDCGDLLGAATTAAVAGRRAARTVDDFLEILMTGVGLVAADADGRPPSPSIPETATEAAVFLVWRTGETAKRLERAMRAIHELVDQPLP